MDRAGGSSFSAERFGCLGGRWGLDRGKRRPRASFTDRTSRGAWCLPLNVTVGHPGCRVMEAPATNFSDWAPGGLSELGATHVRPTNTCHRVSEGGPGGRLL